MFQVHFYCFIAIKKYSWSHVQSNNLPNDDEARCFDMIFVLFLGELVDVKISLDFHSSLCHFFLNKCKELA